MSVAIGVTFDLIGSRAYPLGGDIPIFWQLASSIEQRVLLKRNNGSFDFAQQPVTFCAAAVVESPAAAATASRSARCAAALSTAPPN